MTALPHHRGYEMVVETLISWLASIPAEEICVAARTSSLIKRLSRVLREHGIETAVGGRTSLDDVGSGVRLATMHRLKGTEFKRVILVGVHKGSVPLVRDDRSWADEAAREDHLKSERCLLYVAATRARDELVITGHQAPSPLLNVD